MQGESSSPTMMRVETESHRLHALGLHPGGEVVDLAPPSGRVGAAGACAGDDDAAGHVRVLAALISEVEYRGPLALDTPEGQGGADRGVGEEEPVELLPGVGVFAEELDSGGRFCIERHRLHALGLHPGGEVVDLAPPSGRVGAAGACAGDDDAAGHVRVLEGKVECDVASHGEAADVGLLDFQVFEDALEVVDGVLLGV